MNATILERMVNHFPWGGPYLKQGGQRVDSQLNSNVLFPITEVNEQVSDRNGLQLQQYAITNNINIRHKASHQYFISIK